MVGFVDACRQQMEERATFDFDTRPIGKGFTEFGGGPEQILGVIAQWTHWHEPFRPGIGFNPLIAGGPGWPMSPLNNSLGHALIPWRPVFGSYPERPMVWNTPKIVEIVCGAEINAYVSAEIAST
jgi:coenzyme PQQ precursor peptide PqqA